MRAPLGNGIDKGLATEAMQHYSRAVRSLFSTWSRARVERTQRQKTTAFSLRAPVVAVKQAKNVVYLKRHGQMAFARGDDLNSGRADPRRLSRLIRLRWNGIAVRCYHNLRALLLRAVALALWRPPAFLPLPSRRRAISQNSQSVERCHHDDPSLCNQLSQINLAIELLNRLIALASGCFQILAVQNPHRASRVIDDFFPLQGRRRHAHARPVGS